MNNTCDTYKSKVAGVLEGCEAIRRRGDKTDDKVSELTLTIETVSRPTVESEVLAQRPVKEVFLRYGPYESCGVVDHRTQRLQGIQEQLRRAGHTVHLEPVGEWNIVQLWVHGEHIFSCDIRDLDFGGDGIIDGLCLEALSRVEKAL